MKGVLSHYHDDKDTWRWGIPEKPRRKYRWLAVLIWAFSGVCWALTAYSIWEVWR